MLKVKELGRGIWAKELTAGHPSSLLPGWASGNLEGN